MDDRLIEKRIEELGNKLYKIIANKRDKENISQKIQAKEMGFSTDSNLVKYCKGCDLDKKIPQMRIGNLIRICEYYNISADYMLGFTTDKKLIRPNDMDDELIRAMCDYTGLSRQAIEALHKRKDDFLYAAALSFLIIDKDGLLTSIIEYILTSLYDDLFADDRYNLLPGADKSSKEEGKPFFADALELMPQYRELFHVAVTQSDVMKNHYVSEMAIRCIDKKEIFAQLFPYISYDPTLSPDEAAKKNSEIRQEIDPDNTDSADIDDDYEFLQLLKQRIETGKEISDEYKFQILQDKQLEAFYNECYNHQSQRHSNVT